MASQKVPSKRRLPAWMETVHNQNNKSKTANVQVTVVDFPRQTHCVGDNEKQDVPGKVAYMPEEAPSPGTSNDASSNLSASQVIAQSMPLLEFTGKVVYSCHFTDCASLCEDILSSLNGPNKTAVGFDMEWPVTFQKGSPAKTALIQMCMSEQLCYLFHISAMLKFPELLKNLICDSRLMLVGLNIESDLWKLGRDFDLKVKPVFDRGSVIDVGRLANKKLKSSEHWALDGLCKNVLKQRLNKDVGLRCGDWKKVPLSDDQKMYAATDAFVGLLLYKSLKD